jgi:hypothetical protein
MFNVDRDILLPDAVLVDNEVFAPKIWDEVPVWILYEQFYGYGPSGGIELDFCFLPLLFAFE